MMARVVRVLALVWALFASTVAAHEIRPAYLQVRETAPGIYAVLWKVPSIGETVLDIEPRFDDRLTLRREREEMVLDGFVVYRYRLTGTGGLANSVLSIHNLSKTSVDVLASIETLDSSRHTLLLHPASSSATIPSAPSTWQVVATYAKLGVEHIFGGIDHLLFVAALMLIVLGPRMLLQTISAFTVAHSITLGLATLGLVSLPPAPVEILIALSIVLVCVEAVRARRGETSLAIRRPWIVAFAFGLLHGFGFAGALRELGVPQGHVPLALLFFNVGVEIGQILFIGVVLAVVMLVRRIRLIPAQAAVPAAYAIGTLASFWVFQRLDTMFH
jgi:hypothetical protein